MLLPGLRAALTPLCRRQPEFAVELEAEALTGLWTAAALMVPDSGRLAARMTWAARRSADAFLRAERIQRCAVEQAAADPAHRHGPDGFRMRAGHPDVVLASAVDAGVLSAADAELIGATRLDGEPLCMAAVRLGLSHAAVKKRRIRAETRLVAWIHRRQNDLDE
jgi:hypothetical protein